MCQRSIKKVKKGSKTMRQREVRRQLRIQRLNSPPRITIEELRATLAPAVEKLQLKARVLLELSWKTVALMQKNRMIQEKIEALKKETTEFVTNTKNSEENKQQCLENLKMYGSMASQAQAEQQHLQSMRQSIVYYRMHTHLLSHPFKLEPPQ